MIATHSHTVYAVQCHVCGTKNRSFADAFGTPEQAYNSAVAAGWVVSENVDGSALDLCPPCATSEPCS